MLNFGKVLVPLDFSEFAKKSLETCANLFAPDHPVEFHFLYVWRSPSDYSPDPCPKEKLLENLGQLVADFANEGQRKTHTHVSIGQPTLEICRYAEEQGCDLIVMPTHGRTGVAHLLIGSTAEQVVRHAPCPVLSLRSK